MQENLKQTNYLLQKIAKFFQKKSLNRSNDQKFDCNFSTHNFGMVGFVKELVDEVAWLDIVSPNRGSNLLTKRQSIIKKMTIYNGHVFVIKA